MTNTSCFKTLSIILFLAIIIGCNESAQIRETVEMTDEEKAVDSLKRSTTEKVFYSIPSPLETASILKKAGAKFSMDMLSPIENKDRYVTAQSKALNLGVYGADLSYAAIFDKNQEAMLYLSCTKKLADDLGVAKAFDVKKIERIEANLSNRDSLLILINDSYWESDAFLKENERGSVSSLIVLGGWIEGLHIASTIEKSLRASKTNESMSKRIAEQKISLNSLLELTDLYQIDAPEIVKGLRELQEIYNTIEETEVSDATLTKENANSSPTIGKAVSLNITREQLDKISEKVTEIRNKIIS